MACSRSDKHDLSPVHGGVACIARNNIGLSVLPHQPYPDVLSLQTPLYFVIVAYIVPVGSNWREWTDIDPRTQLAEAVLLCQLTDPEKCIIVLGDLNARTGNTNSFTSLNVHSSLDDVVNTRDRWLKEFCNHNQLSILNGTHCEADSPGRYTCFQPNGCSIVDYVLVTVPFIPEIGNKALRIIRVDRFLSDHSCLQLTAPCIPRVLAPSNERRVKRPVFSNVHRLPPLLNR